MSSTSSVIAIANTPSLNASVLPVSHRRLEDLMARLLLTAHVFVTSADAPADASLRPRRA